MHELKHCLHFHVTRSGQNVRVVQKPARTKEALVAGQLAYDFRRSRWIAIVHIVNGAHVIHATTRCEWCQEL